jgi:LmbE family N-acetylglucosaminyl deacetylase
MKPPQEPFCSSIACVEPHAAARCSQKPAGPSVTGHHKSDPKLLHAHLKRLLAPASSTLPLPRALVVFAHPDDEVIAVGARLERFRESRFICVTDGAPRDGADAHAKGFESPAEYARARHRELENALRHAGLDPGQVLRPLNCHVADQQAAWRLVELTLALVAELQEFQPQVVLTHPYEGGHPDHDACAFAVHAAIQLNAAECSLVEAAFYHAGPNGIETGRFLPGGSAAWIYPLSAIEKKNKRERLDCFTSQRETLRPFGIEDERFRLAPEYDFTRPPHPGRLFYENFDWKITGAQYREFAASALNHLHVNSPNAGPGRSA